MKAKPHRQLAWRALVILFILCVFLTAAFILIPSEKAGGNAQGNAASGSAESTVPITDIPVSGIQALAITNAHGSYGIINSPDGISAVSDKSGNFSVKEMRALVFAAAHLRAMRRLDNYSPPQAEDIEKSSARFTLILSDGRENNFAILQKSPVSDGYLLYFEEQKAVFLISQSNAEWFLRSAEELLDD
jgi:hypothetical protein